jgi:predicted TIM-barrel fold metal-dependent hydrolase
MVRCNVARLAIVPHVALSEPERGNPWTVELVRNHPAHFRGYWYYSPRYPQDLADGQRIVLEEPGMIGFKIHPCWAQYPLDGELYQPMFAFANAHRRCVLSHTWKNDICGTAECRRMAEKYPEMIFLLGHSCFGDWEGVFALGRDFPNVYLELTAAERVPGFIDHAVQEVGSHKILFGTDYPWFDTNFGLGCVLFADITDDDRHNILHRNAERLLAAL